MNRNVVASSILSIEMNVSTHNEQAPRVASFQEDAGVAVAINGLNRNLQIRATIIHLALLIIGSTVHKGKS